MVLVPSLSSVEMAQLDRMMVEEYDVDLLMVMENAGKALALQSARFLGGSVLDKNVLVLAGKGNNGGGGLASARHLHNWGANVRVVLSSPQEDLREAAAKQARILHEMKVALNHARPFADIGKFDLIIDALLGYNQRGNPKGNVGQFVEIANKSRVPIMALDIPTGLDPDTGIPNHPCIRADQTLTLAFPKTGLSTSEAKPYVGQLFLADISIPREYYSSLGADRGSVFARDFIVRLD